ncbi:MAG TPA: pyrroline-5-carboxylate reductase [Patescibacteria group bacterium]|nr:pyrroline-5-carboxylate reductase [Patescibacteria group bacterium]
MAATNILLVGCGKMGGALLRRWQELQLYKDIRIVEPSPINVLAAKQVADFSKIPANFKPGVIVIAVKPQVLPDMAKHYKNYAAKGALVISIAAGKPVSFFEKELGKKAAIVRSMPNTPASIGEGITVVYANRNVTKAQKAQAEQLLSAVGDVLWVADEKLLNPVTALSGSGPAYVFLLIEALTAAGVKIGLDPKMAEKLARQTVIGSAALAREEKTLPASKLRENVTSPGGTTAAALDVLMKDAALQKLFEKALTAASKRAEELSK